MTYSDLYPMRTIELERMADGIDPINRPRANHRQYWDQDGNRCKEDYSSDLIEFILNNQNQNDDDT